MSITTLAQVATKIGCIEARKDWVPLLMEPVNYFAGNTLGIAPVIAAGAIVLLGVAFIVAARTTSAPRWLRSIGYVVGGLMIVMFLPGILIGMAETAPSVC